MKQPAILLLLLAIGISVIVALADRKPEPRPPAGAAAMSVQDAQIMQLVQSGCSGCHSLDMLRQHPQSRASWQKTVNQMIQLGAPVNPDDEPALVDYLARNFGPK